MQSSLLVTKLKFECSYNKKEGKKKLEFIVMNGVLQKMNVYVHLMQKLNGDLFF